MSNLIGRKVLLGFEDGTGIDVNMELHHTVITGITQLSGKTTGMEGIVERCHARAVAFLTKRGESGFRNQREIKPYFKEQMRMANDNSGAIIDWQYVEALIEAAIEEKQIFPRPWIIKVCNGCAPKRKDDQVIPPARSLQEVYRNIQIAKANPSTKGIDDGVYTNLAAYFDIILPEIGKYDFASKLDLHEGFNVVNLIGMEEAMQQLVIESTMSYILENLSNTIVILPEAHKFIPQGKNTPVRPTAQKLIREGAAIGVFLFIDTQETTSVDKSLLKQCSNWIMGYQQEKNEVANVRANLGKRNITDEEIMSLKIGHFMASLMQDVHHVYALPAGIDPELGRRVARGEAKIDEVRAILNARKAAPMDVPMSQREMKPIPEGTIPMPTTLEQNIMHSRIGELERELALDKEAFKALDRVISAKDSFIDDLSVIIEAVRGDNIEKARQIIEFNMGLEKVREFLFPINMLPKAVEAVEVSNQPFMHGGLTEKEVEDIVERKIAKMGSRAKVAAAASGETPVPWVNTWLNKLNNNGQRKILVLIANKHPLPLTKTTIAQMIGVVSTGGSFNSNLAQLVKWNLIKKEGDTYKLPDVPR